MSNDDRDQAFKKWLGEVNRLCLQKFGLSLNDLPDMCTRDAFDCGETPEEFFEEEVMEMMRDEFGSVVDKL